MRIGFLPLMDCAPLVIAQEVGFFAREGVDVVLGKLQTWGQLLERLERGELDGAHLLSTIPILAACGAQGVSASLQTAWVLSSSANCLTLSNRLCRDEVRDALSLSGWLQAHPEANLRFGVVMERSTQELMLRDWLQAGGLELGSRISIAVCAPQEMAGKLREGQIDGFCSGEPWNQRATTSKLGGIVALGNEVLGGHPEKVLAVRQDWHKSHLLEHRRVLRALASASQWLESPDNLDEATRILADKAYVNTQAQIVRSSLERKLQAGWGKVVESEGFLRFCGINRPEPAQFRPLLERLVWWGHLPSQALDFELDKICLEGFHREVFAE
ncbi:MAG: ABC transporter substrate-binding protein [Fibrobacteres bacterium]|nr:ABC transporter substrate-binding protein [Fibrobacterota bacterium]